MNPLLLFAILCIPLALISLKSLKNPGSHGFYRFFGWVGIVWIFAWNVPFWFTDPFSVLQCISWILLFSSVYLVLAGVLKLRNARKSPAPREDQSLYGFERTTELVDTGIYRYIRHPLYSSLIFLTWGIYLKQPGLILGAIALVTSIFFYLTARRDEKECIAYFGEAYVAYMKRSRMFIPFLF